MSGIGYQGGVSCNIFSGSGNAQAGKVQGLYRTDQFFKVTGYWQEFKELLRVSIHRLWPLLGDSHAECMQLIPACMGN